MQRSLAETTSKSIDDSRIKELDDGEDHPIFDIHCLALRRDQKSVGRCYQTNVRS
jgi:hypothetical protein